MKKKIAIILILLISLICVYVLMTANASVTTVNGEEIEGPFKFIIGFFGLFLATVILFGVAILLSFILSGVGIIVLGVLILTGVIIVGIAFPFLLPLLIPLFIVWCFCIGIWKNKKNQKTSNKVDGLDRNAVLF